MPPASRPVKLACLPCRASKIRCNGQDPCSNPSRRGGARRGPAAAEKLAKKETQRCAAKPAVDNLEKEPAPHGELYHRHTQGSTSTLNTPLPISPAESGLRPSSILREDCGVSPLGGIPSGFLGPVNHPPKALRAYDCSEDLINAYYIFIHPYFPLLPPPVVAQYEDKCVSVEVRSTHANASSLPRWPTSPLGLALAAILTLIPPTGDSNSADDGAAALRRSYADSYARSALESLEDLLEPYSHANLADGPRSILHYAIPQKMEPVLALALLSLYECCQRGNVPKMRLRANQALTAAMDLSLHTETPQTGFLDAHRRCWWAVMFLVYQSSIMTTSPPFITFDDIRITTMFPEFRGCREVRTLLSIETLRPNHPSHVQPWPLLVKAQAALLRSCCIGRELDRELRTGQSLSFSIREEIKDLDSLILGLAAEADRFRCVTNYQGAEADASRNLWAISNALIHTSRLTLHSVRAFPDRRRILDGPIDLLSLDASCTPSSLVESFHLSTSQTGEVDTHFPFTERESIRICLHSSLVVSRVFRRLPSPNPSYSDTTVDMTAAMPWTSWRRLSSPRSIPYMASCQMQSFYTLAMVLKCVNTALCSGTISSYAYLFEQPSVTTEVQDAERLVEELQIGMDALRRSIKADVLFGGVEVMAREVERVFEATLMG
ncbi:hypothetical protein AN3986.2 [Aspergillus nidulans FGSC A4]|nr:hypothetical protein AN3986.2 [Aspergillus nidulans FGSC A4]|eukprot:XP_661590.1 hypothetical protein AN3986.2 [Aspergillus nidulans FGSC A4]